MALEPVQMLAAVAAVAVGVAKYVKDLPAWATSALGAAAAFATLEVVDTFLEYPCVAGGHAAVAAILFATPAKDAYETAVAVLGGHAVAAGVALLQLAALPEQAVFATKTIVVAAAVGAQKYAGTVHPPACALAFVMATTGNNDPKSLIGPLLGCAILIAAQQAFIELTKDGAGGKKKTKRS